MKNCLGKVHSLFDPFWQTTGQSKRGPEEKRERSKSYFMIQYLMCISWAGCQSFNLLGFVDFPIMIIDRS